MAMSKKDYEMVAKAIECELLEYPSCTHRECQGARKALRQMVSRLSTAFMANNPRFDPEKFTRACGF